MKKIAYYITAHGYGHGTRSCDILNALTAIAPHQPIIVKTDLPVDFIKNRISGQIEIRTGAFDVGLIQKDSIHVDLDASLAALIALYRNEEQLIAQESEYIKKENVGVVVSDIPAIPLAAAQTLGIPNIACSNFGWDWIYSEFISRDPQWSALVEKFSSVYSKTDLLLRQPFAEPMAAFPKQIDLPLLALPGNPDRKKMGDLTGANLSKRWVLLSFTSLNLSKEALQHIRALHQYELFSVEPLRWTGSTVHSISRNDMRFADILASVDAVITKPGFGIVSECIANDKPIIYSERANFKEYPVLVEAIRRYCRHGFISNKDLYSGTFEASLESIKNAAAPQYQIDRGGAEVAASHILNALTA